MKNIKLDRMKLITTLAKQRMKIHECATRAKVSRATISGILSGKHCTEYTAAKIADVLGCEVGELLEEVKTDESK